MARLPALVDALAAVDGRERGVIDHMAREIREAGLIQTTKRGRGSAEMSSLDAAHLILGIYGSDGRGTAAEAARSLGQLPVLRIPFLSPAPGVTLPNGVGAAQHQTTLAGVVAAVIEAGAQLATQTPRTQGTLPVLGPLYPPSSDGLELENWPEGIAVLLRLHRPSLEAFVQFAWPGPEQVDHHTILFVPGGPAIDGIKAIAAYEVHTMVHARIFQAMHRVLFGME